MSSTPQFGTAEYKSTANGDVCVGCKQSVCGSYYRINGMLACDRCAEKVQAQTPKDSHSAFVRGILFGIGGAIVGLALYAAFGIITGLEIGYVALAVGWLVGKAIKKGSGGIGGRRYQITAVALTYAAVSLAAIPIGIAQIIKSKPSAHSSSGTSAAPAQESSAASADPNASRASAAPRTPPATRPGLGSVVSGLLFLGLASPFLELQSGFSGIIGLVILFVGVNIAWKITASPPLEILGPFQSSTPPSPAPSVQS